MVAKAQTAVAVIPANGIKVTAAETKIKNMGYNPSSLTRQEWANILNLTIYRPGGGQFYADAFPGGSVDPITKEVYTKQETEQRQATYNRDKAKQEIGQIAKEYYDTLYSPFKPGLTDLGIQKATERFNNLISQLQERASTVGITASQFKQTFQDALMTKHEFDVAAYEKINADRGGLLGFLDVATPIITQAGAAIITGGLSIPQQLAVNSALSIMKGGDLEDIVKSAVGTLGANEVSQYLSEIKKISETEPILKNAIVNAGAQGTYAAITGGDVVANILSGAAGGAVAGATFKATDDKAISAAAGEYSKNLASGMSSKDAMTAALVDFIVSDRVDAERKIKEAANETQPVAVKPGSQLGEPSAGIGDVDISAPTSISSLKQFEPLAGESGTAVVKVTDKDGIVTYQKDVKKVDASGKETGYTIVYDPESKKFTYEWGNPVKDNAGNIISYEAVAAATRPGEGTGTGIKSPTSESITLSTQPKVPITKPTESTTGGKDISKDIIDLTGIGKETGTGTGTGAGTGTGTGTDTGAGAGAGVDTGIDTGAVGGGGAATGGETNAGTGTGTGIDAGTGAGTDIGIDTGIEPDAGKDEGTGTGGTQGGGVEGAGGAGTGGEGEGEGEAGGEDQLTQDDLILLGLIGGKDDGNAPTPAAKPAPTASMQALSQALRVGDPGEPLFGSRLGKRKNVWNEESLRIKDELGG